MKTIWKPRIRKFWLLVLLIASLVLGGQITGLSQSPQDAEPAWYQTRPAVQPDFPVTLDGAYLNLGSSPTLTDLDGDGKLEVVVAGRDRVGGKPGCGGMVYAYRHDGSLFWQTRVRAAINSTPTAADLNDDGSPDIVAAMGGIAQDPCWDGGVIALDGLTGQELWTFDTQDWLGHRQDGWLDGVYSTPAIADINGDGKPEVAFGAWDQCIYLLDQDGKPLWGNLPGIVPGTFCGGHGYYTEDTVWSSPALADVTGDGRMEIIIGGDSTSGNSWGDPTGGYLFVFDADGINLAREWMDQAIYSSPAAADLDNDGAFEFVVGTGTYVANEGYYVSAFDYDANASDPADRLILKWRRSTTSRVFASPAIADLDNDGQPDVVITSPSGEWGEDGTFVYAWRGADGDLMFKRRACNFMGQSQASQSSPTIADIDGDSWSEILFSHAWEVTILNHDGTYYTDYSNPKWPGGPEHSGCVRDHEPDTELSYLADYSLYASPAVGDLDGNGKAEVVIGGHNPDNPDQGMLFAWTGHSVEPWPPWPTWRHDENHTGNAFFDPIPPTNPTNLSSPSHTPEVWSTSNRVKMEWSGADDQESGLAGYSIAWDTSPDTLPDAVVNLEAPATSVTSSPLPDGNNLYFHLRTADKGGNWTANALHHGPFWIDATPPTSQASSPELVSGPFQVSWNGSDAGSGISHYTIQVRDNDAPWTTWLRNETKKSATYQGTAGHTYRFRSIAYDKVGHVETEYTAAGDSSTLVAEHLLSGTIFDQREMPVIGAEIVSQPAALNEASSGDDGRYILGLAASGTYEVTAKQAEFGILPPMKGIAVDDDLDDVDLYLPPDPNLVQNGDFELEGDWSMAGFVQPERVRGMGHTGDYALQLGALPELPKASFVSSSPDMVGDTTYFTNTTTGTPPPAYTWNFGDDSPLSHDSNPTHTYETSGTFAVVLTASNAVGEDVATGNVEVYSRTTTTDMPLFPSRLVASSDWTWSISQTLSLPDEDGLEITLAWIYRVEGEATSDDSLAVTVQGSEATINQTLSLENETWTHEWLDLAQFAGQEVIISFTLQRKASGETLKVWLDEITLGTAEVGYWIYLPIVVRSH